MKYKIIMCCFAVKFFFKEPINSHFDNISLYQFVLGDLYEQFYLPQLNAAAKQKTWNRDEILDHLPLCQSKISCIKGLSQVLVVFENIFIVRENDFEL